MKIKLIYNLIGKWGPANNAIEPNDVLVKFVNDNTRSPGFWVPSYLQNIVDFKKFSDIFELTTPYSLSPGDPFIYEAPWNIFEGAGDFFTQMSNSVLDGVKYGRGWILINDAVDPFELFRVNAALAIMDKHEIPRHKIIFMTGSIDIDNINNTWGIRIVSPDWNEIVLSTSAAEFENINDKTLPKLNKFICLNNMWQHHRVHLLWKLHKKDLLKHFGFSFKKLQPNTNKEFHEVLVNLTTGLFTDEERATIEEDGREIDKILPLQVDDLSKTTMHLSHSYLSEHTRYNFYIVPETSFYNFNGNTYQGVHASEKIFKPILYKMPFIVIGPPGVLAALHKKGYKTFGHLIDERYDAIENDRERFAAILNLIEDLSNRSQDELDVISKLANDVTEHNYKNLLARKDVAVIKLINSLIEIVNK